MFQTAAYATLFSDATSRRDVIESFLNSSRISFRAVEQIRLRPFPRCVHDLPLIDMLGTIVVSYTLLDASLLLSYHTL